MVTRRQVQFYVDILTLVLFSTSTISQFSEVKYLSKKYLNISSQEIYSNTFFFRIWVVYKYYLYNIEYKYILNS